MYGGAVFYHVKGSVMLFRSMLVLALASLLLAGCSKEEEEAAPVEPVAVEAPVAAPAPVVESGGYVPTADERVPGITIDAAALDAATKATEAKPATK
jgi:uncharacterized lipoprotein YajG